MPETTDLSIAGRQIKPGADPDLDACHGHGTQQRIHDESVAQAQQYVQDRRNGSRAPIDSAQILQQASQEPENQDQINQEALLRIINYTRKMIQNRYGDLLHLLPQNLETLTTIAELMQAKDKLVELRRGKK